MAFETVRYDVADNGVATIALDHPDTRNALSDELLDDLLARVRAARATTTPCAASCSPRRTRRSSPAAATSSGFAADVPLVAQALRDRPLPGLFRAIGELGKPTLCAANGHVLAGALGLALACDLIVAKEGVRFGTPEINVGVFPFMIMALIYRNVGRKKTNELLLLGEQIAAEEAERIGIVNRVVPGGRVRRRGRRLGGQARGQVAAADEAGQGRDVPPAGHARSPTRSTTCARSSRSRSRPTTSRRACAAFMEKREPVWTGR